MNQPTDLKPGSYDWWTMAHFTAPQGIFDSILRLLECGHITRAKARELVSYAAFSEGEEPPTAPWRKLNWGDDE